MAELNWERKVKLRSTSRQWGAGRAASARPGPGRSARPTKQGKEASNRWSLRDVVDLGSQWAAREARGTCRRT